MEVTEKRKKQKWTWDDTGALLTSIGLIGLFIFLATYFGLYFSDVRDEEKYNYQFDNYNILSYDMEIKKSSFFDDYNIYLETENGQTKVINYYDLYVEKGDNNKLLKIKEETKKGRYRGTDYVLILDKNTYASFNKEYAKTFSKETKPYTNKEILKKENLITN